MKSALACPAVSSPAFPAAATPLQAPNEGPVARDPEEPAINVMDASDQGPRSACDTARKLQDSGRFGCAAFVLDGRDITRFNSQPAKTGTGIIDIEAGIHMRREGR